MELACSTRITVNPRKRTPPHLRPSFRDRAGSLQCSLNPTSSRKKWRPVVHPPSICHSSLFQTKRVASSKRHGLWAACAEGGGGGGNSGEEDHGAVEAVENVFNAVKDRNDLQGVSEVIGEECTMVCDFMSLTQAFQGKKQVLDLFSSLMHQIGPHFHFTLYPMRGGGTEVGVGWSLGWKKSFMPFGEGYTFYTAHHYKGKIVIEDMKIFILPFKSIGPLQAKLGKMLTPLMDKFSFKSSDDKYSKGEKALKYSFLSLLIFTTFFILFKKYTS